MDEVPKVARCCEGYGIDMTHDPECHTVDGRYRCEECDQPFMRRGTTRRRCEFCRKSS